MLQFLILLDSILSSMREEDRVHVMWYEPWWDSFALELDGAGGGIDGHGDFRCSGRR